MPKGDLVSSARATRRWRATSAGVAGLPPRAEVCLGPPGPAAAAGEAADIVVTYSGDFGDAARTQRAKDAFEFAVRRWERTISSSVPIQVDVTFRPMSGLALGHAGPRTIQVMRSGPDFMYPFALADARAGRDVFPGPSDITGEFNSALPNWYFGTDGRPPANRIDFVSVV